MVKIAPSLVATSILDLPRTIKRLEAVNTDYLHFDIEDGSFVREMNLGIKIIKDVRKFTSLPFDVHLMMVDPEWIIPELANIGIDLLSFHFEATRYPRRVLRIITEAGMRAGLAFNPKTCIPDLNLFSPYLYFVNILTTEPELGGGVLLSDALEKVTFIKENFKYIICEVDGGITSDNYQMVRDSGADIIVSGRGIFSNADFEENISQFRKSQ